MNNKWLEWATQLQSIAQNDHLFPYTIYKIFMEWNGISYNITKSIHNE